VNEKPESVTAIRGENSDLSIKTAPWQKKERALLVREAEKVQSLLYSLLKTNLSSATPPVLSLPLHPYICIHTCAVCGSLGFSVLGTPFCPSLWFSQD